MGTGNFVHKCKIENLYAYGPGRTVLAPLLQEPVERVHGACACLGCCLDTGMEESHKSCKHSFSTLKYKYNMQSKYEESLSLFSQTMNHCFYDFIIQFDPGYSVDKFTDPDTMS